MFRRDQEGPGGLTSVPVDYFEGCAQLDYVNLLFNEIEKFEVGTFDGLPNVRHADLTQRRMKRLQANVFRGLTNLNILYLGGEIQSGTHYGNIEIIEADAFKGMPSLQRLDLTRNKITLLAVGAFNGLESLELLELYDNKITLFRTGVFDGLRALQELYLGNKGGPGDAQINYKAFENELFKDLNSLTKFTMRGNEEHSSSSQGLIGNSQPDIDCVSAGAKGQILSANYPGVYDCTQGQGVCTHDQLPYDGNFVGCTCNAGYKGERCTEVAEFKVVLLDPRQRAERLLKADALSSQYINSTDGKSAYTVEVGFTFRIPVLLLSVDGTTLSAGSFGNITYTLGDDAPASFMVSPRAGEMLGQFDATGTYTATLMAVDGGSSKQDVETFTFTVVPSTVEDVEQLKRQLEAEKVAKAAAVAMAADAALDAAQRLANEADARAAEAEKAAAAAAVAEATQRNLTEQAEKQLVAIELANNNTIKAERAAKEEKANSSAAAKKSTTTIIIIVVAMVCLVVLAIGGKRYHTYWLSIQPMDWDKEFARMVASGEIYADDGQQKQATPREIMRRNLHFIEKVGNGQFGEVFKAMLDEQQGRGTPEYMVAAKTVKDAANNPEGAQELVAEAAVMMQVMGHQNLVSIIGVITAGDPLVLVLQYCQHGSVLAYLKQT